MELKKLGIKYGTDKATTHSFNQRSFLDIYEKYFQLLKDKKVVLLEIGVLNGSSLEVWKEYFSSDSKIIGLDIDPSKSSLSKSNIEIVIGSQNDTNIIKNIKDHNKDGFDIIIDDGSHLNKLTIESFNLLFDSIKPGGFYVIEDTHCTYGEEWWTDFDKLVSQWPGMNLNSIPFENKRIDFDIFLKELIENLDKKSGNVFSLHFYSETIIIEKIK